MSRRTETAYKAKSPGKAAQDVKAQGSGEAPVPAQAGSKCCGCVAKDHVPYPGRSVHVRSLIVKAPWLVTFRVNGQSRSEAETTAEGSPKGGTKCHQLSRGHSRC